MKLTAKRIGSLDTQRILALDQQQAEADPQSKQPPKQEEADAFAGASDASSAPEVGSLFKGLRFFLGREVR